ncbi:CRM-domain containing factor CFM2, chloroplastic [Humulus lupulus]|uniref:CRM-domain containing factor CFM2, chloroplastic n=1 Tax=Humulus lupulus TaxID=3486 RepID=UPI002B40C767|nr:CRM-domain containing factor CFM2, chloroplastic [Humulus lupulus]
MSAPLTQLLTPTLPPKPPTHHPFPLFFSFSSPPLLTARCRTSHKFIIRSSNSNSDTQTILPKSAIQRIAEKLRGLGFTEETPSQEPEPATKSTPGEIFLPLPNRLVNHRVGHTIDTSWSTPHNPVPEPGTSTGIKRFHELRGQVRQQKQEKKNDGSTKKTRESRVPTLAELTLTRAELRRLTTLGIELKKKLKVGKAGITEGIVNGIHERWRRSEVVKIFCEDLCRMNMKRTHELLEKKTGGLVVWRSGSKIVLYRGKNYKYPYFLSNTISSEETSHGTLTDPLSEDNEPNEPSTSSVDGVISTEEASPGALADSLSDDDEQNETHTSSMDGVKVDASLPSNKMAKPALIQGVGLRNRVRFQLPGEVQIAEEADRMLDGLGPRFSDWWGYDPQPIDADLLPAVVPGYRRPFRLLPYGVQPKLTDDEMTTLRRLARPLPCHFALGRNRKHQGLAASIVKLWEKCEVAKIAVKRGVQNTNSELMAEELKSLTGGTLIARDREFIVLYRGKDFLPPAVSSAIEERRKYVMQGKKLSTEHTTSIKVAQDELETTPSGPNEHSEIREQRQLTFTEASVRKTSLNLSVALEKKAKAEQLLAELEKAEMRQAPETDKEGITEEERYMLRKIGLRMNAFLLMGRRGVFDGTIENMHLHWKYRELVKVITNEKSLEAVHQVARTLEAESGGILVSVERVSKGYAIIVYRGKNYERPATLRPKTLMNKKTAMKRSFEAQRRESLKLHVLRINKHIDDLKLRMVKEKEANDKQSIVESNSSNMVQDKVNEIESAESLMVDAEVKHGSISLPTTSREEIVAVKENDVNKIQSAGDSDLSNVVGDKVNETESVEGLRFDAEVQHGFLSFPTTYVEEIVASKGMSDTPADDAQHGSSDNKALESFTDKNELEPSVPIKIENGLTEMPSTTVQLSNRERLLLRKQALKMKKRPVIAVGKSNIVTGVVKTIKAHFQKHPLAIVNVKGRAKGTSVQEVIIMLEQATGAVLVSQEPSKIILYRGWGAGGSFDQSGKNRSDANARRKLGTQPGVSPELLAAIKTECGFESQNKEDASSP